RLVSYEIDVFRELEGVEEEDVDLEQFTDEIEGWVIDEFKKIGLDTAKSVLAVTKDDLVRRTELEEETVDEVIGILQKEFE
ncbi:MAG: transcription termination/antitermination protein NusA, partial [Cytophagales bacterium]|nr:transcription termination/antitermination protein NusA [Cytophagales bacterium]